MSDHDEVAWQALRSRLDDLGRLATPPSVDVIRRRSPAPGPSLMSQLIGVTGIVALGIAGATLYLSQPHLPAAGPPSDSPTAIVAPSSAITAVDVEAVSLSGPTPEAAQGMTICGVVAHLGQVAGMAIIRPGSALGDFVPLTGREPELAAAPSVFAVRFAGVLRLPTRAGPGSATYIDAESPTCAAIGEVAFWYVTGPSLDPEGRQFTPPPGPAPGRELPAPLP
jgi:hypothetical protein